MIIPYKESPFDGINNYLFNKKRLDIQRHIVDEGIRYSETWGNPIVIVDPLRNSSKEIDNFASVNTELHAYFTIQYTSFILSVSNYTIRTRTDNINEHFPNSWDVEGSNDGQSWNLIHYINNTEQLSYVSASHTYPTIDSNYYSFFRFKMTNITSAKSSWIFHVSKVEFFGSFAFTKNLFAKITCVKNKTCHSLLFLLMIIKS